MLHKWFSKNRLPDASFGESGAMSTHTPYSRGREQSCVRTNPVVPAAPLATSLLDCSRTQSESRLIPSVSQYYTYQMMALVDSSFLEKEEFQVSFANEFNKESIELPEDFVPSSKDIICGRGKEAMTP